MDPKITADALRDLARAASRLAELLGGAGPELVMEEPSDAGWRSPTLDLQAVVVSGEEDLAGALGRGHRCLVNDAAGGLAAVWLNDGERIRHLAVTLVGDVALEAAHAGLTASGTMVDGMLAKGFDVLAAAAEAAAVPVPAELYVSSADRFPELNARGARWR